MNVARGTLILCLAPLLATPVVSQEIALEATSCVACHGNSDFFDAEGVALVTRYAADVHAAVGLSCHDCHGGDPSPEMAEDMDGAKNDGLAENPFRGGPGRRVDEPGFCGACHSDPTYMKRFRPDARVDQEAEYWTSQHGVALAAGDAQVATCIDCHGAHGIRRPDSSESLVHPTRVASTCASCHSDSDRMRGRTKANGRPLPIDQYTRWRGSVHAAAMFDREDLSAPTCNDCHGNHGAAPPGLESVTFVCGQCHGREAELFRASGKRAGFEDHNQYLAEVGDEGCAACHDSVPPELAAVDSLSECASCHGNHAIIRPTVAMYAALPPTPCDFCHEASGLAGAASDRAQALFEQTRAGLVEEAEGQGLEDVEVFDYLVDRSLELPVHLQVGEAVGGPAPTLRPEFARLFTKFRIGKTSYAYTDPVSGEETVVEVTRCSSCHAVDGREEEVAAGEAGGGELVRRMQELTRVTAQAERLLLRARRGGVETREALSEIDQAVDAQIGLQVLAHSFSTAADSAFMERYREGIEHAEAALLRGDEALAELAFRRRGLAVALGVIVLLLVGLAFKIRQLSGRRADGAASAVTTP